MKRRDFLLKGSAGVIGVAAAGAVYGQAKPCPPPMLEVEGGTRAETSCSMPNWFAEQAEKTWVAVAGGSGFGSAWQNGARQTDVKPSNHGDYGVFANLGYCWTGGVAIQSTGEFGQVVEGGHNTWHGNDIYLVGLRTEVPAWRRAYGPSPIAQIVTSDPSGTNMPFDANRDGTPRTSHGWFNRIASNSRLWVFRTSDGPASTPTTNCWSIDRNNFAAGWMYHGRAFANPGTSSFFFGRGPSAHDPTTDRVYFAMEATAGTHDTVIVDVAAAVRAGNQPTSGPQIPGSTLAGKATPTSPGALVNSWSAIANVGGRKAWIVGSPNYSRVYIMDLANPEAGWITQTPSGTGMYGDGSGAVYHPASQALLVGGILSDARSTATVYKLEVPDNPFGPGYVWRTIVNSAGGVTPSVPGSEVSQYRGTFGKFRIIDDMGGGQSALVMHTSTEGPLFVYKLPARELV